MKQSTAMHTLRTWATRRGLTPSETVYVARTRDRRRLRFSVSGQPDIELAYRTTGCLPTSPRGRPNGCGRQRTSRRTWSWCQR